MESHWLVTERVGQHEATEGPNICIQARSTDAPIYFEPDNEASTWTYLDRQDPDALVSHPLSVMAPEAVWNLHITLLGNTVAYIDPRSSAVFTSTLENSGPLCLVFSGWFVQGQLQSFQQTLDAEWVGGTASLSPTIIATTKSLIQLKDPQFLEHAEKYLKEQSGNVTGQVVGDGIVRAMLQSLLPDSGLDSIAFLKSLLTTPDQ
jgi:hypothetical protein